MVEVECVCDNWLIYMRVSVYTSVCERDSGTQCTFMCMDEEYNNIFCVFVTQQSRGRVMLVLTVTH